MLNTVTATPRPAAGRAHIAGRLRRVRADHLRPGPVHLRPRAGHRRRGRGNPRRPCRHVIADGYEVLLADDKPSALAPLTRGQPNPDRLCEVNADTLACSTPSATPTASRTASCPAVAMCMGRGSAADAWTTRLATSTRGARRPRAARPRLR
jgi:hypothetical protein